MLFLKGFVFCCYRTDTDNPVSPAGRIEWISSPYEFLPWATLLLVKEVRPTKIKRQDMVYDRSQYFILNDISKGGNLTFILKIPTRLTGIKSVSVMESPSARMCTHTHTHTHSLSLSLSHTHTHTQAVPGRPLQGLPGPTALPVELR